MREARLMQWPKKFKFPILQIMQTPIWPENDKARAGLGACLFNVLAICAGALGQWVGQVQFCTADAGDAVAVVEGFERRHHLGAAIDCIGTTGAEDAA